MPNWGSYAPINSDLPQGLIEECRRINNNVGTCRPFIALASKICEFMNCT